MGTISEKLTYLNGTKQKLKQAINNIGGSIDDNTTFRQYANQLQNVYDNLPKTEYQEGTEITLSNTLKGKLDFDDGIVGYGDTKQAIDLTENNLTSQSVNGLTITVNTDKSITINGTASSLTVINLLNNTASSYGTEATARTLQVGTYSLTGCPSGSDEGNKFKVDVVRPGYAILVDTGNGNIVDVTSSQTYTYFRIVIYSGTVCNNLVFRPKLLKIPSPSYPQTINSVTGNQNVVVSGKNILYIADTTETTERGITKKSKDGVISLNGEASSSGSFTFGFFTLPKGTWRLSRNLTGTIASASWQNYIRDENDNNLVAGESSFTIDKDVRCQFYLWINSGTDFQNVQMKPQLERGTEITDYEPYITPKTYQLSLGDIELNAIGNYKDELIYDVDEDKVYKNSKIWKKNITDSSAWEDYSAYWGACSFGITKTIFEKQPIAWSDMYSKYFKAYTTSQTKNLSNEIVIGSTTLIVNNKETSTLSAFRNWLASNPFYIYYQLATAVKEEITGTLKDQIKALYYSHSFTGTTIITSNGNLPMIIKVRGLKGE